MSEIHFIPGDPEPIRPRGMRLPTLMALVLVVGAGIGLLLRVVNQVREASREAARAAECVGHLKQIAMALHEYHDVYSCLPPAYVTDPTGKPMHSWRTLILPFIGTGSLYGYNLSEPWDGPNNRKLLDRRPAFYHCPSSDAKRGLTSYVMLAGPGTAFPGSHSIKLDEIRDGTARTIVVAEVANVDIPWTEPRDLDVGSMSWAINDPAKPGISSRHAWPALLFADGHVRRRLCLKTSNIETVYGYLREIGNRWCLKIIERTR